MDGKPPNGPTKYSGFSHAPSSSGGGDGGGGCGGDAGGDGTLMQHSHTVGQTGRSA